MNLLNKPRFLAAVLLLTAALLAGCEAPGAEVKKVELSEVRPEDYVRIPEDLSDLSLRLKEVTGPSEESVNAELEMYRDFASTLREVTDRSEIREGDIVNIDYTGKIDGEEIPELSGENYDLEVGAGLFFDEFDTELPGKEAGTGFEVRCRLPAEYYEKQYAGKEVVFIVKVNSIQEKILPELTDALVAGFGMMDYQGEPIVSVEQLRAYIREGLETQAEYYSQYGNTEAVINELVNRTEVLQEYPEGMLLSATDRLLTGYGQDPATVTQEEKDSMKDTARGYLTEYLAVRAVAEREKISVTEEEVLDYAASLLGCGKEELTLNGYEQEYYEHAALAGKVASRLIELQ